MRRHSSLTLSSVSFALVLSGSSVGAQSPRFKAIFEPVNYQQDLEINDIVFVNDSVGWAGGAAGTILHTTDRGKTWAAQLGGDPKSDDRPIAYLRFVNDRVGFAVQSTAGGDHRLYRTTDGQTWTEAGTVGQHRGDYQFTSTDNGVYVYNKFIYHTTDGGKNWKPAYTCDITLTVQGLNRNAACHFEAVSFPTPETGYAISRNVENAAFVVARTTNGGAEWTSWTIPEPKAGGEYLVFTDKNNGFVRMWGGKLYSTRDGGKTWTAIAGATLEGGKPAKLKFANAQVGWGVSPYGTLIYTADGGKRWTSRKLKFPATINASTLTSPTSGYVAGEHGMVYRYRIVPIDYKGANVIDAPALSAGGAR
ncbi:MAG: YCF48-related protein [Gemmatimonadota bacterium]|nr:YCF48-related protein [Gemmatimonadota bacterium]